MKRKAKSSKSHDQAALKAAMELLRVSANYSKAEVLRAFRRKAKHARPDAGGGNEMMRLLIEAKELLLAAFADSPHHMPAQTAEPAERPPAITPIEYTCNTATIASIANCSAARCRTFL
jgi:hypothetical protein